MEGHRLTCCVAALIWSWVRVSVQYFLTSVEWNGRFCCSSSKDRSITLAFVGSGCIYLHWSKIIQIESSCEVFKDRQYKHQRYNCWIKIDCSKTSCCKRFLCWVLPFRVVQRLREKILCAAIRDPLHDAAQPILMTKHRCIRNLYLALPLFHCTVELPIFLLERFTSTKNPFICATLCGVGCCSCPLVARPSNWRLRSV